MKKLCLDFFFFLTAQLMTVMHKNDSRYLSDAHKNELTI